MNWQLGLRRISAVFWGVPALLFGGIFVYTAFDGRGSDMAGMLGTALLIVAGMYVAHRITCWIISGFFKH